MINFDEMSVNWFSIKEKNIKEILFSANISLKPKKSNNEYQSNFFEGLKKYQKPIREDFSKYYKIKNYFNTFIDGKLYKDGGLNKSFKVIENNFNIIPNEFEAEICVIQNIINKSINDSFINKKEISKLIITSILECFKYDVQEKIEIYYYKEYKIDINNSLEELKKISSLYQEIFINKKIFERIQEFLNKIQFYKIDKKEIILQNDKENIISFEEVLESSLLPSFISKNTVEYIKLKKDIIDKIANYVFSDKNITNLKNEQFDALKKIINDKTNILAVLKTGFGKSLIYQLFAFLQPNIMLAFFPINALIMDQSFILTQENKFEFTMSNQDIKDNNNLINNEIISHKRLFLITAERMENIKVNHTFKNLSNFIGTIVFDEAHCISEWGHDFRPSYLVARHITENIKNENKNLKTIALTATAAPYIQNDIMKILNIPFIGLINIANTSGLHRKELKYKLIKKDDNGSIKRYEQKEVWKDIALETGAKVSKKEGLSIIYFIYAACGKWNNKASAEYAFKTLSINKSGLYTGSNKEYYDQQELLPLNDFGTIRNLKMMFATKSFGMGINLENCNYVALIQPPSSLEDLYQQSGRAGRKGQNSLIEIFYSSIHLEDPMLKSSPFSFFLTLTEERQIMQPIILTYIIEMIKDSDFKDFNIDLTEFKKMFTKLKKANDFQNYVKWSIGHLINEFNIVSYYTVTYIGLRITEIQIFLNKKVTSMNYINNNINKTIQKYSLNNKQDMEINIETFYKHYFEEISKQRKTGINIFVNELRKIDDQSNIDSNVVINNALNNYYKTKNKTSYTFVDKYFALMENKDELDILIDTLKKEFEVQNKNDLRELISRHPNKT